jgi:hypothetical protein
MKRTCNPTKKIASLILSAALLSCSTVFAADEVTPATGAPLEVPPALTASGRDFRILVRQIQIETEAIWGGHVGRPVDVTVLDQESLRELLGRLLAKEAESPAYGTMMATMEFLRLIPEDSDASSLFGKLLEGQVGGLYDPDEKALYVVDTFDPEGFLGGIIISHEITHAIQDAKWNLTSYVKDVHQLDKRRARLAAIEGDATVTMVAWGQDNFTSNVWTELLQVFRTQADDLNRVPQPMVQELLFPYLAGVTFCMEVAAAKGAENWRAHLGANPPASTEQILHPAKYLADPPELPIPVELPSPADGAPFLERYRNTKGEWGIRVYLALPREFPRMSIFARDPILRAPIPTEAAAGWGGDQYVLLSRNAEAAPEAMAWRTVWDSEQDAREFINALRRKLRFEGAAHLSNTTAEPGQLLSWARVDGATVDVVLARDQAFGTAVRDFYFPE